MFFESCGVAFGLQQFPGGARSVPGCYVGSPEDRLREPRSPLLDPDEIIPSAALDGRGRGISYGGCPPHKKQVREFQRPLITSW